MKLAVFGRGSMGRAVVERARAAGHEIGRIFDSRDAHRDENAMATLLRGHDVAIDFSTGDAVPAHTAACVRAGLPLVEGATGWQHREAEVRGAVTASGGGAALVYGPNFSIGANLFYRLVTEAAVLFQAFPEYEPFIEEAHHARKRDQPSGTALRLRDILTHGSDRPISVASTRAGHIPGTHRVGFDSPADQITLEHTARSREGFAAGALLAAAWIRGRRGVFTFDDVVSELLASARR